MSEFPAAYQEAPLLSPAEQHLLNVLTIPDRLRATTAARFESELEQLVAVQPTIERQEIVRESAKLLRWGCFARAGEPLPPNYEIRYTPG
ncbi:MAG TPA: hypothetical protein VFT53_06885 [Candidatus Saccharimonadales bacterium]|nr:hypothetical protein [Candidatus Saccharimonadales bacterium]